jgi:hypothetical protein
MMVMGYGTKTSGKGGNKAPFQGWSKQNASDGGTKTGPTPPADAVKSEEKGTGKG